MSRHHPVSPRSQVIQVRFTLPERTAFSIAAQMCGISMSEWVRQVCRNAARLETSPVVKRP